METITEEEYKALSESEKKEYTCIPQSINDIDIQESIKSLEQLQGLMSQIQPVMQVTAPVQPMMEQLEQINSVVDSIKDMPKTITDAVNALPPPVNVVAKPMLDMLGLVLGLVGVCINLYFKGLPYLKEQMQTVKNTDTNSLKQQAKEISDNLEKTSENLKKKYEEQKERESQPKKDMKWDDIKKTMKEIPIPKEIVDNIETMKTTAKNVQQCIETADSFKQSSIQLEEKAGTTIDAYEATLLPVKLPSWEEIKKIMDGNQPFDVKEIIDSNLNTIKGIQNTAMTKSYTKIEQGVNVPSIDLPKPQILNEKEQQQKILGG